MTWSEQRRRLASRIATAFGVAALIAAALFLLPVPYIILGPGSAVDLGRAITVPHHSSPPGHFYLTDVDILPSRPFFFIAAKLLPGFELIPRQVLVPPKMSDKEFNRVLMSAMEESQLNAQIVAEKAAGLKVKATSAFVVVSTVPHSPGARCFRPNDEIRKIDGQPLRDTAALSDAVAAKPSGSIFALTVKRGSGEKSIRCGSFVYKGKSRFGINGRLQTLSYYLPVHVKYDLPNINGSSAGLMFALQIFRTLTSQNLGGGQNIAGTGVLEVDGKVDPIEGAREKVRAAVRAHAAVFFIPLENYREIQATAGIRVIPVKSFAEAVARLRLLASSRPESRVN